MIFCLDRAGLVGEDGATHHGIFDLAFLRTIPNMNILAPKDENELRQMIFTAAEIKKTVAIRYPRGSGLDVDIEQKKILQWGKAEYILHDEKSDIVIFAAGSMVQNSVNAAKILRTKNIFADVINARFIKPLDKDILKNSSRGKKLFVTCEEGTLSGGMGSAVAEFFADENISVPMLRLGIKDSFIEHGSQKELLELCGLSAEKIAEKISTKLEIETDIKIYKVFSKKV